MRGYVGQDEILRAVVKPQIQGAAGLDKRVTNPLQVVNLTHAGHYWAFAALSMFANSRYAPGTPAGSSRNQS